MLDRDVYQGHRENRGDDHRAGGVAQEVALDVPPEEGDSGGDEVLLLVLGAEEPLVDLGEEAFDPHDQEEELEHPDSGKPLAEGREEIQHQEDGDAEPDAAREGPGFEPLEGGVLEGAP